MTDSTPTITENQAKIAAAAWHEIRPDWGIQSMMTMLAEKVTAPGFTASFAELLRAGINAALNPKAKTPAVIFQPGKHWLDAEQAADPARTSWFGNDTSDDCPNHPTVKAWDCKPCRRADPMPPNFRARVEAEAERVRAARAAQLTPPKENHGSDEVHTVEPEPAEPAPANA
ncbi:hypothetical protein SEA_MUFASA8_51 [Arthrobacter phage Mufasa8]|uniref:Uncharacterized protein n=1 Tax=Arthrobacter phage Mufasa8 TaxID=2656526 RepID=A0A649VN90_9CAUD|nr:hypothetical protein HYQ08_gp051 [Arthrobacter phage Mufasa8]QGJ93499.1 hypothetical protein SEA_MUFASA8_51 [Arthrobacter phage Mufasa8]